MAARVDLHKLQQIIKWSVYSLLIINWGFYIVEDWTRAIHTLDSQSTLLEWAREFATSIDEAGWFILLFMFELETYILEDEQWKGWVTKTVHFARLACYAMILHTVYAYAVTAVDYQPTVVVGNATSLCDLVDEDVSYVYSLEYTKVTAENCGKLSEATELYRLGDDPAVVSAEGLELERQLALADLVEAVAWLVIVVAIEIIVRFQERDITGGRLISLLKNTKLLCYTVLIVLSAWWATLGHWLYTWDEFLWIAGFAAIEMNLSEWRDEIEEERLP